MMTTYGWSSVSDCLIKNKCFICEQSFQKGKLKKVFQLSQLVTSFMTMMDSSNNNNNNVPIILSNNLKNCYDSFLSMPSTDCIEKATMLEKELLKNDIALWMSGLVCCISEECMVQYMIIVPDNKDNLPDNKDNQNNSDNTINTNTITKERKSKKSSIFTFANNECGPNCKCDSPWKYEIPADRSGGDLDK